MRKATAAFVHPGDVHVPPLAMSPVICTLRMKIPVLATVISESPSDAVVSGAAYDQGACTYVKVVPGNVHVSEVRRGWVVVSPTGLPVVAAGGVNTKMSPAGRVQGLVDLYPPDVSPRCRRARR